LGTRPQDCAGSEWGPAAAGIHGGDKLEARREAHMRVGARDHGTARLDRLPQRIENGPRELRQLVEEENAEMGKADLARLHVQTAADQRCHRRCGARKGRVRESAPSRSSPARLCTMETSTSRASSGGSRPGSRLASMDLPAPGGPIINILWPPAAAISSARFAVSCLFTSLMSGAVLTLAASFDSGVFRTVPSCD
jgi:hypothetical protein